MCYPHADEIDAILDREMRQAEILTQALDVICNPKPTAPDYHDDRPMTYRGGSSLDEMLLNQRLHGGG